MKYLATTLLFAGVVGCVNIPPPISPDPGRTRWEHEPTIGSDVPLLDSLVIEAVSSWRWGRYIGDCRYADICVTHGFMEDGISGRAYFGDYSCHAEIMSPRIEIVIHEIGHCLGLGHSTDRRSFMYPTVRPLAFDVDEWPIQSITYSDREALAEIVRQTL